MTDVRALQDFVFTHERLFVLTGAGCSTASGIPDYRDADGAWRRGAPINYRAFMNDEAVRRRYWARSMNGWPRFSRAAPNGAHLALAMLESAGRVELLLTQNVDRLHQAAGSVEVIDLHGRLDRICCTQCWRLSPRAQFQSELIRLNPRWVASDAANAPDGDSEVEAGAISTLIVPECPQCGGVLKPDVVFFGQSVPRDRVDYATRCLDAADAVLVIGSSLMVYSGFRFVDHAARAGKPIAAVNLGKTRADTLFALKIEQSCEDALAFLL